MRKRELLYALGVLSFDKGLRSKFEEKCSANLDLVKESLIAGILDEKTINLIEGTSGVCYKIGDKVFLHGETKGSYDFVGDDVDSQAATELFDMTTEIEKGDSYSIYVSCTEYFEFAPIEDTVKGIKYLKSL